ncbi:hypothetical protein [Blastococcus sp. TF02A-30]|uniref:hypothetical protein n=1 Tax=Blastococcus sp. TF02A-30 TaxID=2250580 RepID=UPI000DEBBEBA|nr:hypothetical protein [Blastococcus sp. TF02A-30]RBY83400.1 hypothetical protein DQ241_19105 [Blastococcus sp. TF02A-30]
MAGPLVQLLLILLVLCAVVVGYLPAERWLAERRARRHVRPPHRPLQLVAADIRRLAGQLARVPAGAPMTRRRALEAAYDDVLCEAAEMLDVPQELRGLPEGKRREAERHRLVAALAAAGLAVGG